ncbi:MAG TPA: cytochrome c [Gaiellaceae bacterium]
MRRWVVPWLIVGLTACTGCGGTTGGKKASVGNSCSDSGFAEALPARLAALERAVLKVDAGHGNVPALSSAAPVLVTEAKQANQAARGHRPCREGLVKARASFLVATRGLVSAGRALEPIAGKTSRVFSQSQFLDSWYQGTEDFQHALVSLRAAGVPGLVSATDGQGIFTEAGCATCHTLKAAHASGTVGPNLDEPKPLKADVVSAVTEGSGVMISFKGALSASQIQTVADFVSQSAGK